MQTNPEKDQDWVADLFGIYNAHNYTMFPQQRAIYSRLVPEVSGKTVLEAGCGVGLGTAILSRTWNDLLQNLGLRDESHA